MLSQASLVRASSVPDRRERGLTLLTEAARMNPEPAMVRRLRSEAVQFLALRDLEPRGSLRTGRGGGLVFTADAAKLAISSREEPGVQVWGLEDDLVEEALIPSGPRESRERRGDAGRGPGGSRLARAGEMMAVLWPDGQGVRLIGDPGRPGHEIRDLALPRRDYVALYAHQTAKGPRLVTIERLPREDVPGTRGGLTSESEEPDRERQRTGLRVELWDPENPTVALATLAETEPGSSPLSFPLVALAPDGGSMATAWFLDAKVTLWSSEDGSQQGEIDTRTSITALAMGPQGIMAVGGAARCGSGTTSDRSHSPA